MSLSTIPTEHPARRATLGDQLRRNALRHPDRDAIVSLHSPAGARRVLTYRELNEQVNKVADVLAQRGVARGDVVALMGRNCPEHLVVFWAALKLGAACTGVNYTFTKCEMHYQISHSGAKVIVAEDAFVDKVEAISDPLPDLCIRIVNDAYGDDNASEDWERFTSVLEAGSDAEVEADVDEGDLAIIPYTSGTTALPKAVEIPHRNYIASTIPAFTTGLGLIEDDTWYYTMPFHTIAGMGTQMLPVSLSNTIILPFTVDPGQALTALVEEKVTVVAQTPTFYLKVIAAEGFADADLSALRHCITYGGTMPQSMFDAFAHAAPNADWVTFWSQSELSQTPIIGHFNSLADIPNGDVAWIGRPTAQLEVRVIDDEGNDADEGELLCRSPGVMKGYYKDAERTAEVMKGDWLHTGDLVRIDEAGDVFFVDRKKDLIKTGGMNVSSQEVERVLYKHPALLEVAVVGIAHKYWSQAVTAFVTARPNHAVDPDEVIAFCKQQLAGYKVPKTVHVVDQLPKDTQGKILKRELRDSVGAAAG